MGDEFKKSADLANSASASFTFSDAVSTGKSMLDVLSSGLKDVTKNMDDSNAASGIFNSVLSMIPYGQIAVGVLDIATSLYSVFKNQYSVNNSLEGFIAASDAYDQSLAQAGGALKNYRDSLYMTTEEQSNLGVKMSNIFESIGTSARAFKDETGTISKEQIQNVKDNLAEFIECADEEMAVRQSMQAQTSKVMERAIADYGDNAVKYKELSKDIIATSIEEKDLTIATAQQNLDSKLQMYDELLGTSSEFNDKWYETVVGKAKETYADEVAVAEGHHADVLRQNIDHNNSLYGLQDQYYDKIDGHQKEIFALKQTFDLERIQAEKQYQENLESGRYTEEQAMQIYQNRLSDLDEREMKQRAKKNDKLIKDLDILNTEEGMAYAKELMQIKQHGGDLSAEEERILNTLMIALANTSEEGQEKGQELMEGFGLGIDEKGDLVYLQGQHAGEAAMKGVTDVCKIASPSKKMKEIGGYFTDGFGDGIANKAAAAAKKSAQMVTDAINAAKKAQQSASPSKVTRGLGKDNADGYALGIKDNAKKAASEAKKMAEAVNKAIEEEAKKPQITITAVLDTLSQSEIARQVSKMNAAVQAEAAKVSGSAYASAALLSARAGAGAVDNSSQTAYTFNINQPIATPAELYREAKIRAREVAYA